MDKELPKSSKVVVIGGGVAGTSCAYHLAKFGWKDVVLLERDQLTSGTTWHAAGLMGQLGASSTITKLRKYTLDLYQDLEKKTGLSIGLKQNGAITVATTNDRMQELLRQAKTDQLSDVEVQVLNKKQTKIILEQKRINLDSGNLQNRYDMLHKKDISHSPHIKYMLEELGPVEDNTIDTSEKLKERLEHLKLLQSNKMSGPSNNPWFLMNAFNA